MDLNEAKKKTFFPKYWKIAKQFSVSRKFQGNFPRGKKAINDISIIAVLTFILFGTAIIIPFVNEAVGTHADTFNTGNLEGQIRDDAESVSTISAFTVLITMFKLAIFDFGDTLELPFWLDAIYTVLGIILIIVIARNLWIGGGA